MTEQPPTRDSQQRLVRSRSNHDSAPLAEEAGSGRSGGTSKAHAEGHTILLSGQESFLSGRVLVWFSCGAPSASAAKLAVEKYKSDSTPVEVVNCDTLADEHSDNARFLRDVQEWIGWPIKQIRSSLYGDVDAVNVGTRYMSSPKGARCSMELKKAPRLAYQWAEDTHIWGLAADEEKRIADFEWNNPELRNEWILRDRGLSEAACREMVAKAGIRLPRMYELGYEHNNCKGCLKATSPKYWNMIRRDFPDTFALRARRSRELGVRLVRLKGVRIFLDELPADEREEVKDDMNCGPACNPPSSGGGGAELVGDEQRGTNEGKAPNAKLSDRD